MTNTHFPHRRVNYYYNCMFDGLMHEYEAGYISEDELRAELRELASQEQAEREAYYKENNSD